MDDDWLDEAFPRADGVADTTAHVICPYCHGEVEVAVDPGGGKVQEYVEDCEVCCRPWHLLVTWDATGAAHVRARTEQET